MIGRRQISWPTFALLCVGTFYLASLCAQSVTPAARSAVGQPLAGATRDALAWTFARLIEDAIPAEYDKRKDWGRTKNITTGFEFHHGKLERKKKPVKHGVWKHYRAKLVDPDQNLTVRIENFQTLQDGRAAFTLVLSAKLDIWARAKIYEYGIHVIALEAEGETAFDLEMDCDVGVVKKKSEDSTRLAVDPHVTGARLTLHEFRLNRVSDAHGPVIEELGEEVKKLVEEELEGPRLTAKLNRAIDKKRHKLEFTLPALLESGWWPLAELPAVGQVFDEQVVR